MKLHFPHPLILLLACVVLAALATHLLPAGQFDRRLDPESGNNLVVAGSFKPVEPAPLGIMQTLLSVPRGMLAAGQVIATVFLVGGAFVVIDRTGALRTALFGLARVLNRRRTLAIPICCLFFAAGGVLENMQEEIIALAPVLVLLATQLGFDRVTAVAMSAGAAIVGSAMSPINPFQVLLAQKSAEVATFSGAGLRIVMLVIAVTFWILWTLRYARRHAIEPAAAPLADTPDTPTLSMWRTQVILCSVVVAFGLFVYGLINWQYGFDELSAIFLVVGLFAGLVGRLGWTGTAEAFGQGFRDMAVAALLIGFARAIFVVLEQGRVIDTVVHALSSPLVGETPIVAALGMMGAQALIHIPVPSVSGQAVLTMPVMAPVADVIGMSRQVAVLAFQCGAGFTELVTPTNGAVMATLAAAGVKFEHWIKFVWPAWLMLMGFGAVSLVYAVLSGYR
ncbi:MAG: YfcC family protein [Ahniella sp.]|nr:YfcC family protein [Ahniella sp.]